MNKINIALYLILIYAAILLYVSLYKSLFLLSIFLLILICIVIFFIMHFFKAEPEKVEKPLDSYELALAHQKTNKIAKKRRMEFKLIKKGEGEQ